MPRDATRRWDEGSDIGAVERAAEVILAMLERVVSGGQTGADQAGWRAAQANQQLGCAGDRENRRVTSRWVWDTNCQSSEASSGTKAKLRCPNSGGGGGIGSVQ